MIIHHSHRDTTYATQTPSNTPRARTATILVNSNRVSGGRQNRIGPNKRLRAGAEASDVLTRGHAVVRGEVGEERLEVAAEAGDLRRGDEAEDVHVAVVPFVQLPRRARERRRRHGASGRRDGARAA